MIQCSRCGEDTPLLRRDQKRCPRCEREVAELIRADEVRRHRFASVKDLTGARR